MSKRSTLAALALIVCAAPVAAVPLAVDGSWATFDVDALTATSAGLEWIDITTGNPLDFTFTVPVGFTATLTVVDAGFAGDMFAVYDGLNLLGSTSTVAVTEFSSATNLGLDFDAALADPAFSRATFTLAPGSYAISGLLTQSVQSAGMPLNATVGGISVSVVPEPATVYSLLAGLGLLGAFLRRRA
jgi:PEP-CTERM motif